MDGVTEKKTQFHSLPNRMNEYNSAANGGFNWTENHEQLKMLLQKQSENSRNRGTRSRTEPFTSSQPIRIPGCHHIKQRKNRSYTLITDAISSPTCDESSEGIFAMDDSSCAMSRRRSQENNVSVSHRNSSIGLGASDCFKKFEFEYGSGSDSEDEENGVFKASKTPFIPPHQMIQRSCFSLGVHHQFRPKPQDI